jgi:sugar (pentulose or hexulose) kinase
MVTPKAGWAEQDPDLWWRNVVENIPKALEIANASPSNIIAVGVCGQMHATVPLDSDGDLLSHGVKLWCDKRCAGLVDEFKMGPRLDEAMQLSGNPPVSAWLGFNIQWLKAHQSDLSRTWKFVTSKGFVNYRLVRESCYGLDRGFRVVFDGCPNEILVA